MSGVVNLGALMAPAYYPIHHAVKSHSHDEIWLKGGRGSGKSSFVSLEIILGMLGEPEANAIIYRKVADTLRDSVYAQMLWAAEKLGVEHLWQAKLSPMELVYKPTGQRVIFRGADDPQKSKGIKLQKGYFKYIWFEELTEFRGMEDVRTIIASVARGGEAIAFYSYNPPISARNWTNAESLRPHPGRLVMNSSYLDVPREWLGRRFIAEAEALKAGNERAYRHMYLGEITGAGGNVFDNLHIAPIEPEAWQGLPTYCGQDFGFAVDPDAFVRCAYDRRRGQLFLVDEFVAHGLGLDELARAVKRRAGLDMITADSADPRSINELRARGLRMLAAKKGPDSVSHGLRWLQTRTRIFIDPAACPVAAKEFSGYEYDRDKDGSFISRYPDMDNHTIDAVRYAMESVSTRRVAVAVL